MNNDPNRGGMNNVPSSSNSMPPNHSYYQQSMNGAMPMYGQMPLEMAMNNMSMQQHQMPNYAWNVNATEFVPRNVEPSYYQPYQQQQQHYQSYPSNDSANWYNNAQQQQPYDASSMSAQWMMNGDINESHIEPSINYSDRCILAAMQGPHRDMFMEIQVGIEQLITSSEDAEMWREAIVGRLTQPRTASIDQLEVVAKMIFETAALHPDHHYTLAMLFAYMVAHPSLAENFLMRCVLPHCRAEHEKREYLYKQQPEQARRFASLLAELFLRLMTRSRTRLGVLKTAVFEQLECLMKDTSNDANVMAAMRIVKTVGRALYEDDPDGLDAFVDNIKELCKDPPKELGELTKTNLKSTVKLHDNRWGLPAPAPVNKSESSTSSVASPTAQPKHRPAQPTATTNTTQASSNGGEQRSESLTEDERRIEEYLAETMKFDQDDDEADGDAKSKSADDEDAALEEFLRHSEERKRQQQQQQQDQTPPQ